MIGVSTRKRPEVGIATIWAVWTSLGLMLVAGLVIDGGYTLAAKREAARIAEQAARIAADQLNTDSLRTGGSDLDRDRAAAAGRSYLSRAGESGTVSIAGDEVTVTVRKSHDSVILSIIGSNRFTVSSSATATSIDGTD